MTKTQIPDENNQYAINRLDVFWIFRVYPCLSVVHFTDFWLLKTDSLEKKPVETYSATVNL